VSIILNPGSFNLLEISGLSRGCLTLLASHKTDVKKSNIVIFEENVARTMLQRQERHADIYSDNIKERVHMGNLMIDGRVTLKCIICGM
jgi:hypothetical protein